MYPLPTTNLIPRHTFARNLNKKCQPAKSVSPRFLAFLFLQIPLQRSILHSGGMQVLSLAKRLIAFGAVQGCSREALTSS